MITKYQSGGHMLGVNCEDEKLKETVLSVIQESDDIFSFKQLCNAICRKLDNKGLLEKEKNVVYEGGIKLKFSVIDKIQYFAWEQIWERKLIIDLLNDEYRYTPDRESLRLIKIK